MAILKEDTLEVNGGIKKRMDQNSMRLVFENQQKFLYQNPEASTIRETVSNAKDSVKEREIARRILSKEAVIEDYYDTSLEGDIYEASKFDPSYYDLNYLSDDNQIYIKYFQRNDEHQRDLLTITDYGVGLGGKRLWGYFDLAYSTKRTSKNPLGKFGLGAKAPLSMVDSFRMTTRYNGKQFVFDIYLDKLQSVVPRWNDNDEENPSVIYTDEDNSHTIYYTETEEKNGVTIELEVKKGLRNKVKEIIKEQLMYFDDVVFDIITPYDGWENTENVVVKPTIYYQSANFIISNNSVYTVPHLILGQEGSYINYGPINFPQLELETRRGNIGIVADIGEVDILPNREGVVWSEKTKDTILAKFQAAIEEATNMIKNQLNEEDFLKWLSKSNQVWSNVNNRYSQDSTSIVLGRLSNIINKEEIRVPYSVDNTVKYGTPTQMINSFAEVSYYKRESVYRRQKYVSRVERTAYSNWSRLNEYQPVYFSNNKSINFRKDLYIMGKVEGNAGFSIIRIPERDEEYYKNLQEHYYLTRIEFYKNLKEYPSDAEDRATVFALDQIRIHREEEARAMKFIELAKKSSLYRNYDDVVVPDDYRSDVEEDSTEVDGKVKTYKANNDKAKARKANQEVVYKTITFNEDYRSVGAKWLIQEVKQDVLDNTNVVVFGANTPDDEKLLYLAAFVTSGQTHNVKRIQEDIDKFTKGISTYAIHGNNPVFSDMNLKIIKASKSLIKELDTAQPVDKFLLDSTTSDNGEISIFTHKMIRQWYTARIIYPILQDVRFLNGFKRISPYHAKLFQKLWDYAINNGFDSVGKMGRLGTQDHGINFPVDKYDELVETLDKLYLFQRWLDDEPDSSTQDVVNKAVELIGVTANSAFAAELDIIKEAEELRDWAEPINVFFNSISYLTNDNWDSENREVLTQSLLSYMQLKGVETREIDE